MDGTIQVKWYETADETLPSGTSQFLIDRQYQVEDGFERIRGTQSLTGWKCHTELQDLTSGTGPNYIEFFNPWMRQATLNNIPITGTLRPMEVEWYGNCCIDVGDKVLVETPDGTNVEMWINKLVWTLSGGVRCVAYCVGWPEDNSYYGPTYNKVMQSLKDFVLESGTSNGWSYNKWNSGVSECWRKQRLTVTNVTS